jgi:polyisoprenoid-binding protein YceI
MRSTCLKPAVLLLGAILLASCALPGKVPPGKVPAPAVPQAAFPPELQGAQLYRLDPQASTVHILVYRGGTMANMGHNHVISAAGVDGYVWRHTAPERCGFDIVVPVNALTVDDNSARSAQGADFPLNVDDAAKQGTKSNMLSEAVLDGAHFPVITLRSIAVSGAPDAPLVNVKLQIRNQARELTVPVTVTVQGAQLQVKGEFKVKQSDFGITPFSVALGALTVVDDVTVRFNLVGLPAQP